MIPPAVLDCFSLSIVVYLNCLYFIDPDDDVNAGVRGADRRSILSKSSTGENQSATLPVQR